MKLKAHQNKHGTTVTGCYFFTESTEKGATLDTAEVMKNEKSFTLACVEDLFHLPQTDHVYLDNK